MFRLSITLARLTNVSRLSFPSSLAFAVLSMSNLKLLGYPHCQIYYSMMSGAVTSKISTSNGDFSVNSSMARLTWLISEFSREGRIGQARQLFDKMCDPDVITWTIMVTAYIKSGMIDEARKLFDRPDAKKNVITWTAMVGGYVKAKKIMEAEKLFKEMPDKNVVSWNTMMEGYVQNAQIDSALYLFKKMRERNVVSWNTVINALAQCGRIEEALRLFECMPQRDVISWTAIVGGLSKNARVDEARELFDRMPERNAVTWCAMITGYAQNLRLDEAFELFQMMPKRDAPTWNSMISGFIHSGDLKRARTLFNEMPMKNVVSWTTLITGYVQDGENEEALRIFSEMQAANHIKPNQVTFLSVLGACSNLAGLCEGQQIHQIICKMFYQDTAFVVSALINMYSKCGELGMARKIFDDGLTSQRDVISWNGMIAAYAHHGRGREVIRLFRKMRELGFKPDDATYVGLLSACSHAGLVDEGLEFFDELESDLSINIREDHYVCLVDLCGRAGRLKQAFDFVEKLGTKASASVLGALLAACNVHGNADMGKLAAKKLLELEPEKASTYSLVSNMYASSGKWKEAEKVRRKMRNKGLKKPPGCSWIEVENRFSVFLVGDMSHSQSKIMCSLLRDLHEKMKKAGYVVSSDLITDEDIFVTYVSN